jgi:septal ring factor EnvC (AmiA/AmiB activator)
MYVTEASEAPSQTEQLESAALSKRSSRKSIVVLSLFALAINGSAAIYTLPSSFPLPNVSSLAELLPHQKASVPKPDPVAAALKDIQSAQQQHAASLQESSYSLQQNTALLEQESTTLASLRQSITDERVDAKKISAQLSSLIAKIDALQIAMTPEITSAIPKGQARNRLSGLVPKRMTRQSKPLGPISVGGAPLGLPATTSAPEG